MIENYLLKIGMRCGTVKNFNNTVSDDIRRKDGQHWYFLTPIKISDKGTGLKECTVNMAYPFLSEQADLTEQDVIKRLSPKIKEYEESLLNTLRKMVIVPSFTFSVIPFWANEKGERLERKDSGNNRIHIINASLTIKYREHWFNCNCN